MASPTSRPPGTEDVVGLDWRSGVKKWFTNEDVKNLCDFNELFAPGANVKVFTSDEKGSVSDSVIVKGELNIPRSKRGDQTFRDKWNQYKRDIIVKATFPVLDRPSLAARGIPDDRLLDGAVEPLKAEIGMYEFVDRLHTLDITPHFMGLIGVRDCTWENVAASTHSSALAFKKEAIRVYAGVNKRRMPEKDDPVRLLLLEAGRDGSVDALCSEGTLSDDALLSLVFQVLYTVYVLASRGGRHADLHAGNVFVDRVPEDTAICYYLPGIGMKRLETRGFVAKLFDWDWGGIYEDRRHPPPKLGSPTKYIENVLAGHECATLSSCEKNMKADAFTFLSFLYHRHVNRTFSSYRKTRAFIEKHVNTGMLEAFGDSNSMLKAGGFRYRLCAGLFDDAACPGVGKAAVVTGTTCDDNWEPPDCFMSPLPVMLQDFGGWSADLSGFAGERHVYGDWSDEQNRRQILAQVGNEGPRKGVALLQTGLGLRTPPSTPPSSPRPSPRSSAAPAAAEAATTDGGRKEPRYLPPTPLMRHRAVLQRLFGDVM